MGCIGGTTAPCLKLKGLYLQRRKNGMAKTASHVSPRLWCGMQKLSYQKKARYLKRKRRMAILQKARALRLMLHKKMAARPQSR